MFFGGTFFSHQPLADPPDDPLLAGGLPERLPGPLLPVLQRRRGLGARRGGHDHPRLEHLPPEEVEGGEDGGGDGGDAQAGGGHRVVVHEGAEAGEVRVDAQARQGEVHARVADLEEGTAQYSTVVTGS